MDNDSLKINEIFLSIQGESTRIGRPCVFVRLTGCHLRCTYCDTAYAFTEGVTRTIAEILKQVADHPTNLIEITGGEPLLQKPVHRLISRLCDLSKTVLIETSGACDISECDHRAIRVMDLKTPGSGELERNLLANIEHLTARDEVKFIITSREDYEWARSMIEQFSLIDRCHEVLLSPVIQPPPEPPESEPAEICEQPPASHAVSSRLTLRNAPPGSLPTLKMGVSLADLAQWILDDGLEVRLQPQLHKLIWGPHRRGT